MTKIVKSSRHQKIIGNYSEALVCNWLSRSGWEVAIVDHTGIDIVAYNPKLRRRLGISVKSRTRNVGKENTSVTLFQKDEESKHKLTKACKAFACEPWIAIYVETLDAAEVYMIALDNFRRKYSGSGRSGNQWRMSESFRKKYRIDPEVKYIRIKFETDNWGWRKQ